MTLCAFWQSAQSACPAPSGWKCISWMVVPKGSRKAKTATNRRRVRVFDVRTLSPNAIISHDYIPGCRNRQQYVTPVPAYAPVIRSIPAPSPKSNAKAPVRRRRTWNSSNARLTRRPERGGGMNLRIDPVNFSAAGGFKASSFMRGASQARRTLDEPPHNPVPFTKAQANRRKSSLGEL